MLVFFIVFIVYLYTLFPSCAPYRDTGEMVTAAAMLGVAHPPGYPLYVMLSKAFSAVAALGSAAYRLNALSAVAGALTAYFIYRALLLRRNDRLLAGSASLIFAFSYLQWYLSLVSEMYTLNTLFAAVLIYLALKMSRERANPGNRDLKLFYLASFIFGLGLGNRMDLLLIGAGLAWMYITSLKKPAAGELFTAVLCFFAGFTVFAYLPIRSAQAPILDWNHPADLDRFWGSLTRKTHGGTLDLISTGYAAGANFAATIKFYFGRLLSGYAFLGVPLAALGAFSLWKKERVYLIALFLAWFVSGPFFVYLSNMPPNTHALVILEAHFLLPNLVFFFWIYEGVIFLSDAGYLKGRSAPVLCAALALFNLFQNMPELNKRGNFISYDFAKNVFRSLPPGSIVVAKKDVQLFALWNRQFVEKQRPDLAVVPQGLSASDWYKAPFSRMHPGISIGPLNTAADWAGFVSSNSRKNVYFTGDSEYVKPAGYSEEPDGLVNRITAGKRAPYGGLLLDHIYPYRGEYRYSAYKEFFTPDLIEDYAKAFMWTGLHYVIAKDNSTARKYFFKALAMKELMPQAWNYISYSYFDDGNTAKALESYRITSEQYEKLLELAAQFNANKETMNNFRKEFSDALVAYGVVCNSAGNDRAALDNYARAIEAAPWNSRAYYNRSVIYWKLGEWARVVSDLENTLRYEPSFNEAAAYLQRARENYNRMTNDKAQMTK